ncbi:MAG: anaerobic ribonucleoside-triphosphate reductase activating protein [Prevotella sp.]|nr:anaerobic ribonucleoside-triphosphate reductase activating protein [Bacteroides sp.]MCM1365862.1 anaerobic ribonucleoside-triphosphate reductase activating protein [Prevotella sp.]
MKILNIIRGTTVDGPGFRTAVYMSGCTHACPDCHNPQSHNPFAGEEISIEEIMDVIREEDFDVTLTGGDPLMHVEDALEIAKRTKKLGHTVWLYTGYTLEQILASERLRIILPYIDAIVDGPFIKSLHDPDLLFRGSSNQRIIYGPFTEY